MHKLASMNCNALPMHALILPLLTACATGETAPPRRTTAVQTKPAAASSGAPEPLACSELPPLAFNPGNPAVTPASVAAAMAAHPENPLGYARGELGDTKSTREAIATNRAKRVALGCTNP